MCRTGRKSHLMIRWAAYWCRQRNWADMLARAARQFVWRYLSYRQIGNKHKALISCQPLKATTNYHPERKWVFRLFLRGCTQQEDRLRQFHTIHGSLQTHPGPGHVELDGPDYHKDQEASQGDLSQRALRVPADVLQRLQGEYRGRSGKLTADDGFIVVRAPWHRSAFIQ